MSIIQKNISKTYQHVVHCDLPSVSAKLNSGEKVSLFDGKGNKLSYSFDNSGNGYFKNLKVNSFNSSVLGIDSTLLNVDNCKDITNNLTAVSGTHQKYIEPDNNTRTGVNTLIDGNDKYGKLIANVEYLNTAFANASSNLNNEILSVMQERRWDDLIAGITYSPSITVNSGPGCNGIMVFASCNILVGESHSRTPARSPIICELKTTGHVPVNDSNYSENQIDVVYTTFSCYDYWTTGNKSPSSYAKWIQCMKNITLCGCTYVSNNTSATNENVTISLTTNQGNIYDPMIICIRCTLPKS